MQKINTWIFDLDNTLYPSSNEIFNQIRANMTAYVSRCLKLCLEEAAVIQKTLFNTYGTTLRGLMSVYNVDPRDYLNYIYNIDTSSLNQNLELNGLLKILPGKKVVFTNAGKKHALRIIDHLGMQEIFNEVFSIEDADFIPKPDKNNLIQMLTKFNINPETSIFFDDIWKNLMTASQLKMQIVLIDEKKRYHEHADHYVTPSLLDFFIEFKKNKKMNIY